jgi:lactobin A/cerein 7B family class IIb bacteriocin
MQELDEQQLEQVQGGATGSTALGVGLAGAYYGDASTSSTAASYANPFQTSGSATNSNAPNGAVIIVPN